MLRVKLDEDRIFFITVVVYGFQHVLLGIQLQSCDALD